MALSSRQVELDALEYRTRVRLAKGLAPLLDARSYAALLGKAPSEMEVTVSELSAHALTSVDCDLLAAAGVLEIRGKESHNGHRRNGVRPKSLIKLPGAVVALTRAGVQWVEELLPSADTRMVRVDKARRSRGVGRPPLFYDQRAKELYLRRVLVIGLASRATNRRRLLAEFEDQHWQRQIDNPLTSKSNRARAQQLRDAVFGLNELQKARHGCVYVQFHADEKGHIAWYEVTAEGRQRSARRSAKGTAR